MTLNTRRFSLFPVSLIWMGVVAASVAGGLLRGIDWPTMWPVAAIAAAPALLGLILTPFIHREWAQITVIFGWLALAIVAVLAISFLPMAILFMCVPAAAALFEREKVIEAMVIAAIVAATLFYAAQQGFVPDNLTDGALKDWGEKMGIFATLAFLIGALMTTAHERHQGASLSALPTAMPSGYDAVPGQFFLLDKHDKIVSLNQSAREEFELNSDKGLDITAMLGLSPDARERVKDLLVIARENGGDQEINILASFNESAAESVRFTARQAKNGQLGLSIRSLTSDAVSDDGAAQENIIQLKGERDKIKKNIEEQSLFFAGVSHELRTPLNAIIGFSDMMRSRLFGPLPGKYADYADMIHDSGQHMLDLIGDVLDLSKIEAGKHSLKYDSFQAADIIRSCVKMVRPSADAAELSLEADIDDSQDIILEADRRAVRQILLNLLSNAIKFSPKGSLVEVKADVISDNLRISVIDQGEGMSPDMVEKIGAPYLEKDGPSLSSARGSGLGLSLVKSLVDMHQGDLTVESEVGSGTAIHVTLPLTRA